MNFKNIQVTRQNRMTQTRYNDKKFRFYSKGAWNKFRFIMPPCNWISEKRTNKQLEQEMENAIISGKAKPYPSANKI